MLHVSVPCMACAIHNSCMYLSAILRVESKVRKEVHLIWVHHACEMKGNGM